MLSVIVPAYREESTVYAAMDTLVRSLERLGRPYEIILVSDGNTDGTAAEATRYGGPVRVVEYPRRRGKGYAVRQGIGQASGDVIAIIDADMELHPDGIAQLVKLVDGGADAAVGSKRHPRSTVRYPPLRRFQSAVYQQIIRLLFDLDVTDTQTGLKAFRGDALRAVAPLLTSDGFAFDLVLLVEMRSAGATIVEGPVQLDYAFQTTTGLRAVIEILRDTDRIRRTHRRRRRSRSGSHQLGQEAPAISLKGARAATPEAPEPSTPPAASRPNKH